MHSSQASHVPAVEAIRRDFPALRRQHDGRPVAYFDGPGGTQIPRAVGDAITDYLYNHNANARWEFASSKETDDAIAYARGALADWLGGEADEVAFGSSMTTLTFQISRVLSRRWNSGDNVVVTEQDHHANVDTWKYAAAERGVEVRTVRVDKEGALDLVDFAKQISSRTRLVAFSAASNVLGRINPVDELVAIARRQGALVFVDAVHYSGHLAGYAKEWDCDFLACSAYKFYGPRVAAVRIRKDLLDSLDGIVLAPAPSHGPSKLERGILNHEGIVGAAAAVDYLASLGGNSGSRRQRLELVSAALHRREMALFEQLWCGVSAIKGIDAFGPEPGGSRTSTLSFCVSGLTAKDLCGRLAQKGLFLSHGNFYAQRLVHVLGQSENGLARAGCAMYSTAEEVDRLLSELRRIRS